MFGSWKSFPAASPRFSLTRSDEPDLFVGLKLRCVGAAQLKCVDGLKTFFVLSSGGH